MVGGWVVELETGGCTVGGERPSGRWESGSKRRGQGQGPAKSRRPRGLTVLNHYFPEPHAGVFVKVDG